MKFDDKYLIRFDFTGTQITRNLNNAVKDLHIAKTDGILDVKFNYSYSALLKAGIALLSYNQIKVKSAPGHHVKIIEILADELKDETIADIGNAMRSKRNIDMYAGGVEVSEKECLEYIDFVGKIISKVKALIKR